MPQNKNLSSVPDDNFEHKNKNEDVYLVLARKYRPKNFQELIGQEAMVDTFKNAFKTGRIAQAFIFTGVRGVGKTTTARILARALNYETDKIQKPDILLGPTLLFYQFIVLFFMRKYGIRYNKYFI